MRSVVKRCGRRTLAIASALMIASPARADLPIFNELLETMLGSQTMDGLFLRTIFGTNTGPPLRFVTTGEGHLGEAGTPLRSFTYSLLPGQTYLGQVIALTASATYDPVAARYQWTKTGQRGTASWTASGTAIWFGDPETIQEETVTVDGVEYTLTGEGVVNPDFERGNVSTATYRLTPTAGGPTIECTGPDRVINATQTFRSGAQCVTAAGDTLDISNISVLEEPGEDLLPFRFEGEGELRMAVVPEPSTAVLVGAGLVGLGAIAWRGRRGRAGGRAHVTPA
jgi:hypothetical protein